MQEDRPMNHLRDTYATVHGDMPEHRDCVVRAVSVASGKPYSTIHAQLKACGRKDRRGTKLQTSACFFTMFFPNANYKNLQVLGRPTLSQFVRAYPTGRFVLFTRAHALALVDGIVHDWKASPKRRLICCWQLQEEKETI